MDRIIAGYQRFRETQWPDMRELYRSLATHGQAPRAIVIACSDSRVDPQMILGAPPGQLFVVRNVANLVPPYRPDSDYKATGAALEFAVKSLKVRHVIVMGHARCGGIAHLLRTAPSELNNPGDLVGAWVRIAAPARDQALAEAGGDPVRAQHLCEREGLKVSLANLATFPWIADAVRAGDLQLHGWYFDIEVGDLLRLDEAGQFSPVTPEWWETRS